MSKKIIISIAVALILGLSAAAYYGYKIWAINSQSHLACVSLAFPHVIIQHNKDALNEAIDSMQDSLNDKATVTEKVEQAAPSASKAFISKTIDDKYLLIAKKLRTDDGKMSADERQSDLKKEFDELAVMFEQESPAYLIECVGLFKKIAADCGGLDEEDDEEKACVEKYKDSIGKVLAQFFPSTPAE